MICKVFWAALQLLKQLVVPLFSHDNLTEDILYVSVLSTVASICSHQTSLVSDSSLDVIDGCGRGGLLQRRIGQVRCVCGLLDAVDGAGVLVHLLVACGLL